MSPDGNQKGAPKGLMAPIPGMTPGGPQNPGAMLGQPGGQSPGGSSQSAQAGNGGLEAGQGTAAMGDDKTEALKAARDATVVAQTGEAGDSTTRAIQGKARAEAAQRQSQAIIINAVSVEEQALDEKALPLSRKEHVQRYFTGIRRQFEEK